jgi:pilus assembly protein CpaF
MSLSDRLDANRNRRSTSQAYVPPEVEFAESLEEVAAPPVLALVPASPREELKAFAVEQLYERLGARLTDPSLSEEQLLASARQELAIIIGERAGSLSDAERRDLIDDVADDALGLGPLQRLLDDPTVSEIMVNGSDHIYVERHGRLQRTAASFRSEERLRHVIERIVSRVGRRIDESSPLVDARLPDGSRVNAIIPPLAMNGSALTIRKFATDPFQTRDLVELGSISAELGEVLYACVQARLNIIVSGGTGTGKTTLLNVLSSYIPADDRVVTIEDAAELQLQQEHVVRLESRPPNIEGRGEVTIRDLVRNALRMRPDRIVVGECRGGEALDMLQAMNTGHDGSLSTVHANSPRDAISRLETLTLMAGMDLPLRAVREQIASAVDLIIHITRLRDGSRRVTQVTEVIGMEGDTVTLQDAFAFDFAAGMDDLGRYRGTVRPTGLRPRFTERFDELGVPLDSRVFDDAKGY